MMLEAAKIHGVAAAAKGPQADKAVRADRAAKAALSFRASSAAECRAA